MSWDTAWEEIFSAREWGRYPPEELIRFVARHFFQVQDRKQVKILEIGCGTGANIWFLAREGMDAYGIDGSPSAIIRAGKRLEEEGLSANLQVGDIINLFDTYSSLRFDAIIDLVCLQHNALPAVKHILDQVMILLKPGGKVFSLMVAVGSYGEGFGTEVAPGTFVDISEGPLQGKGLTHFFTLEEIHELFQGFSNRQIEYSMRSVNNQQHFYKHWVIEGTGS
jgi:SAM-dependent methyltransferase